ncbi:MAG: ATP-binding protein [Planctomycetes bacterium]|nr:ATP-binding protein [Planctomycetota bacterium]
MVEGVDVRAAESLPEVVAFFRGTHTLLRAEPIDVRAAIAGAAHDVDFRDIRGQGPAKRGLMIAAAGGHNALLIGPAGCGKTMMARALPGIMPPLEPEEALEVTRIWSAAGVGVPRLVTERPFRAPHHTASTVALVGGGAAGVPRPGEVTLAHHGVLFMDELPEFGRSALEALREPLEDGFITVARAHGSARFPARSILVAAMNPTARGNRRDGTKGARDQEQYMERLSGPIVDRIDLHVEVRAVPFERLASAPTGEERIAGWGNLEAAPDEQRGRARDRCESECLYSVAQVSRCLPRTPFEAGQLLRERAPRIDGPSRSQRLALEREYRAIQSCSQRKPFGSVPDRDVRGVDVRCTRERSANRKPRAFRGRDVAQRIDGGNRSGDPSSHRRPCGPVPTCDAARRDSTGGGERASRIERPVRSLAKVGQRIHGAVQAGPERLPR